MEEAIDSENKSVDTKGSSLAKTTASEPVFTPESIPLIPGEERASGTKSSSLIFGGYIVTGLLVLMCFGATAASSFGGEATPQAIWFLPLITLTLTMIYRVIPSSSIDRPIKINKYFVGNLPKILGIAFIVFLLVIGGVIYFARQRAESQSKLEAEEAIERYIQEEKEKEKEDAVITCTPPEGAPPTWEADYRCLSR